MAGSRLATMRNSNLLFLGLWLVQLASFTKATPAATNEHFAIQVVDDETGRGVPLVSLRTVNKAEWWTDSSGIIAFDEPGLMNLDVFFHINSPGYEYPKDMFGNRGVKLKPAQGGSATIKIKRLNIAERLYRITGQGIYRDSVLLGRPVPLKQPLLNGQVMGQDTVIATPYRGKIYWFWGDTDPASYPLGNFGACGATSELPGHGGLDPGLGVDLTCFVDASGFSKPMCQLPGPAAHWIESLMMLPDGRGGERLVASVANHTHLGEAESWDLMVFNDEKAVFEQLQHWDMHEGHNSSHPFRARVDGVDYFYLFPNWRVKANLESLCDLMNYEALTCVAGDGKVRGKETELDRDRAGRPRYQWKAGAERLDPDRVRELISAGKLKPEESWIDLHDFETGVRVEAGRGSVYWNDFRRRWVMLNSSTKAGEIWFAEADTPTGPWAYARRVVTHGEYNFYNPTQDPFFDQEGGRLIYFEGTYSDFFSGARTQTPRYDYNQIMYRLSLDDIRLALPVAVYRVRGVNGLTHLWLRDQVEAAGAWERIEEIAFFALPSTCRGSDCVPVYATEKNGTALSLTPPASDARPLFVGLPLAESEPGITLEGSWECRAVLAQGEEFKFSFQLSRQGENVRLGGLGPDVTTSGTFRDGKLTLTLKAKDGTFILEGRFDNPSLIGSWRKEDGTEKGTWSASPVDTRPPERRSPVLVALTEYRRSAEGRSDYSTQPQPPPGSKPGGRPLCRVWKAPGTVLTLDWKAQVVPTSSN
jgi:hypothetical protein